MWKTALTFFSLASLVSTQAHLPDRFKKAEDASETSVVLLNEDKTPRCKLTDNTSVEGLRECDRDDIAHAQMFDTDSVQLTGVGGKVFMGLSALVLAVGNAVLTCGASLERDEADPHQRAEGPGGAIARGLGASIIHTAVGFFVMGKQQLMASALWGLFTQLPASYGAYYWCNEGLDKLVDYAEEHGEAGVVFGEDSTDGAAAGEATLASPTYSGHDYSAWGDNVSFSLSFDDVPSGDRVDLFTDAACTQAAGSATSEGGWSMEVDVSGIAAGTHSFYARTHRGDETSACTLVLENFEVDQAIGLEVSDDTVLEEELGPADASDDLEAAAPVL